MQPTPRGLYRVY